MKHVSQKHFTIKTPALNYPQKLDIKLLGGTSKRQGLFCNGRLVALPKGAYGAVVVALLPPHRLALSVWAQWNREADEGVHAFRVVAEVHVVGGYHERSELQAHTQTFAAALYHGVGKRHSNVPIHLIGRLKCEFRLRGGLGKARR